MDRPRRAHPQYLTDERSGKNRLLSLGDLLLRSVEMDRRLCKRCGAALARSDDSLIILEKIWKRGVAR